MNHAPIRDLERIEIERSAAEASHARLEVLAYSESNIRRYLDPPTDTSFPLEYSYALLGDVTGRTVLDYGCGTGENTVLLARRGASVTATDVSFDLIQIARRRLAANGVASGVDFVVGSAYALPFADESVDVVFGIAILHHLELHAAAREVKRVLRAGGRAIFQEPVRNSKALRVVRRLIPYTSPDVSPFERPLTDAELSDFADGFRTMRAKTFVLPHVRVARKLRLPASFVNALYAVDAKLLRRFPRLEHYATTEVVELVK